MKKIGTSKRFDNWLRNKATKESIKKISNNEKILIDKCLIKIMNEPIYYRGTYIHKNLIIYLVSWISSEYAIQETVTKLYNQNIKLKSQMKILCNDRVIKSEFKNNCHCFILFKNNANIPYLYRVSRIKEKDKKKTIIKYRDHKILLNIDYNPNTINLWDRIKEKLKGRIKVNRCLLRLLNDYTQTELIKDIEDINNERFII